MIVLDSNQLWAVGVHGNTKLTMLRAVASMAGHRLAIPQVALTELLDHFEREYGQLLDARAESEVGSAVFQEQTRQLLAMVPRQEGMSSWRSTGPQEALVPTSASARQMREARITRLCQVLPAPDGAAAEGLRRESNRTPPARERGGSGRGGRDVTIWLTALDAAKAYPGNVYFVSEDGGFQDPDASTGRLHPDLNLEARRAGCHNLVYCPSAETLVGRLSHPAEAPDDLGAILSALPSDRKLGYIVSDHRGVDALSKTTHEINLELDGHPALVAFERTPLVVRDEIEYDSHDKIRARQIGDTVLTATCVRWRAARHYQDIGGQRQAEVPFAVQTSMLLRQERGRPISAECWYRWPAKP